MASSSDIAQAFTVAQVAEALGVEERRVRTWETHAKILVRVGRVGIQFARDGVVRCALLLYFQERVARQENASLALALARAVTEEQVDVILAAAADSVVKLALHPYGDEGPLWHVEVSMASIAPVRERMAAIPW
jgi:hypothetical protein